VPVDEVAELLRRWREAGGVWSRGRVLLDAAQLAGRLTPRSAGVGRGGARRHRRTGPRTPAGGPHRAAGRRAHLQAFADGLLELEGARLDQVIAALEAADERLDHDGRRARTHGDPSPGRHARHPRRARPAAPTDAGTTTGRPEDEALDERLRDLAALEHLGDEELQGIRLGEIELGEPGARRPGPRGDQELGRRSRRGRARGGRRSVARSARRR
jgi:hypothetical protein